jgi:outer membrane protein assembly factor BamB
MMFRRFFALAAALGLCLGSAARSEDWPEFRGPTGQGLVRQGGLPLAWGPDRNVVWKQAIPGKGWSSPVVAGGRVYLTTSVAVPDSPSRDQSLRALCLDASSGRIVWEREVFRPDGMKAPRVHAKNSHASPTPLVADGRLYVHFGHQGTACLDLDGTVRWRNDTLAYPPVHGNGGSPILVDGALIFSADGAEHPFVAALDRQTGKLLWKTERGVDAFKKFSFSTPLLITVKGQKQVVSPGSNAVCAYDPGTGREIWRVRYQGYSVIPRPVFGHGLVFLSTGFDSPSLLAVRPDGEGDVTDTHLAWSLRKGAPLTPSPLLVGDELYLISDSGTASCLEARTGKVYWQQRLSGTYSASPWYADGKVYFLSEQGTGTVVKADRQFTQLARNVLNERTLASAAAVDGALYLRTETQLYRFQER